MKIITICSSLKFASEILVQAERLELAGYCVLNIILPSRILSEYGTEEIKCFSQAHLKKIDLSDAIFVINKDGYIGEAVKNEITYAKKKNKEIIYLED